MPKSSRYLAAAIALVASHAYAQQAMMRFACDDDSQGAEISVDGKVVGDCPLDIQVKPGTFRILATKKVDAKSDRVFETEVRLGPGVAKKIPIELGAPRLNAEAQRQAAAAEQQAWQVASGKNSRGAFKTYLAAYPQGRFSAEARRALQAIPAPARPNLPFSIPDAVWTALEDSEAFGSTLPTRPARVAVEKSMATGVHAGVTKGRFEIKPMAEGYVQVARHTQYPAGLHSWVSYAALGGLLELGSTQQGTGPFAAVGGAPRVVTRIEELQGSLFPLAVGTRLKIRTLETFPPHGSVAVTKVCKVVQGPMAASTLNARLAGNAWRVGCDVTYGFPTGPVESGSYFHYLEASGIFTSLIAVGHVAFPEAGSEIVSPLGTEAITSFNLAIE